ncbi:hypothetical protein AWB79_05736 [Caballeronia hypogeia]|uniref:Uncharacterized protein n=1 Tax=Caballeronia hypogeia TaxID=1777140 RepID=A0A158CPE0_9BURK|nr:hypothetical protein [Caballeronia hypogeia]SAK84213.1 hypothetical protein AWB79_05736 [Caballeronia hypogeia]
MNFLLLSQLPRVDESRNHYDALLHLDEREARVGAFRRFFRGIAALLRRA